MENAKEDAFEAQCHVTLPLGVNYVKAFASSSSSSTASLSAASLPCYQSKAANETRITCDIGNPMPAGSARSFTIRVAPQSVPLNQELIKFNITASSSNREDKKTLFDNENFVYVVLDALPSVTLIGKQYQEQVIYESSLFSSSSIHKQQQKDQLSLTTTTTTTAATYIDALTNEFELGPEIMHEYKLMNKGPSQALATELLVAWPRQIKVTGKNRDFLYLVDAPYLEGPIRCATQELAINPLNLTVRI